MWFIVKQEQSSGNEVKRKAVKGVFCSCFPGKKKKRKKRKKKENSVKEELGWEHLSVIVWKQVLARQNQQYQEGEGSKEHGQAEE